jgi:hypothetical protein
MEGAQGGDQQVLHTLPAEKRQPLAPGVVTAHGAKGRVAGRWGSYALPLSLAAHRNE